MYIIVYNALNMALGSLGLLTCGLAASPVFRVCFWGVRARTPSSYGGLLCYLVKSYIAIKILLNILIKVL